MAACLAAALGSEADSPADRMTDRPINALPLGIELDGYVFGEVLGRGGFGITYRAEEKLSGRPVAVKEYFPGDIVARLGSSATVRPISNQLEPGFRTGLGKFIEEARILGRLNHPGIVRVLRVFEANDTAYYVMEFEAGVSLAQRVATAPLDEATLRRLAAPLLDALAAVHAANILHRDIKPSNILVLPDRAPNGGAPKLIDFGAAKGDLARLTRSTEKIVTPGYSPWEQYHEEGRLGPWSDLYAVGATFYRCVTGVVPPPADRRAKAALDRAADPLVPLARAGGARCSAGLVAAVEAALRLSEAERPQSVAEFRALLDGASYDVPTVDRAIDEPAPRPRPEPRPRGLVRRSVLAIGLGAAALGGAGALAWRPMQDWLIAREFAAAVEAFAAGDYKTALAGFRRPAETGMAEAQYRLGHILQRGLAGAPDGAAALGWYERATRQNHKAALHEMALMYFYGAGVARDYRAARQLLARAAALEHGDACYHLGIIEEQGLDGAPNDEAALGWYRRAERLGVKDAAARIRDIEARRARPELEPAFDGERHPDKIFTADWSRDGRRLATACEDGRVRLVDAASGRIARAFAGQPDKVFAAAFARSGRLVVAAGRDRSVRVYNAADGAERHNFSGHTAWVNYAAFSPDETLVASASGDGTARLWPLGGGTARVLRHPGPVRILAFGPSGRELATGAEDGPIRIWSVANGELLRTLARTESRLHALEYDAAGTHLLAGEHEGRVFILELGGAGRAIELRGHAGAVYSAAYGAGGRLVASAGQDGTLRLWNAETGEALAQRRAHGGSVVYAAAFSPAGDTIASAAADGTVKFWTLKRRTP
jgi:serine/threonine protein kinase